MKLNLESIVEQTVAGLLVLLIAGIIAYLQRKTLGKYFVSIRKWVSQYWKLISLLSLTGIASWILTSNPQPLLGLIIPALLVLFTFLITKNYLYSLNFTNQKPSKLNLSNSSTLRTDKFSQHFDEILGSSKRDLTGLGLRFLNVLKKYPPFLDTIHEYPIISLEAERTLTEYFQARDFVDERKDSLRGGYSYQVKNNEDVEAVAYKIYGDSKFTQSIKDVNHGAYSLSTGMYITLPYIDIANPDIPPGYINFKVSKAEISEQLKKALNIIKEDYGLVDEEVLPLLQIAYKAAQLVLRE